MCNVVGGFRIMPSRGQQLRHDELNILTQLLLTIKLP
jgi:hypothetical protein